jgi:hypothetical protein
MSTVLCPSMWQRSMGIQIWSTFYSLPVHRQSGRPLNPILPIAVKHPSHLSQVIEIGILKYPPSGISDGRLDNL